MTDLVQPEKVPERMERPLDSVKIGQFWWVTYEDGWGEKKKTVTNLLCVDNIGSNHVHFTINLDRGSSTGLKVGFNEFENTCNHTGMILGFSLLTAGHLNSVGKMREFIEGFN